MPILYPEPEPEPEPQPEPEPEPEPEIDFDYTSYFVYPSVFYDENFEIITDSSNINVDVNGRMFDLSSGEIELFERPNRI